MGQTPHTEGVTVGRAFNPPARSRPLQGTEALAILAAYVEARSGSAPAITGTQKNAAQRHLVLVAGYSCVGCEAGRPTSKKNDGS